MKKSFQLHAGSNFITLQQLLKSEGIAHSGGAVKVYLEEFLVRVNGMPETRRGKKLYPGDLVKLPQPEIEFLIEGN